MRGVLFHAAEALQELVFLKTLKERIEAGTATAMDRAVYERTKDQAWENAKKVVGCARKAGVLDPQARQEIERG